LPPELTQEVAVWRPSSKSAESFPAFAVSIQPLSVVRYKGNGHTIYITNLRLSPAASKLGANLGDTTTLPNGKEIGTIVDCDSIDTNTKEGYTCANGEAPNQISFRKGNMIVNIASDIYDHVPLLLAIFRLNE